MSELVLKIFNATGGLLGLAAFSASVGGYFGFSQMRRNRKTPGEAVVVFGVTQTILFAGIGLVAANGDRPGGGMSAGFGFVLFFGYPIYLVISCLIAGLIFRSLKSEWEKPDGPKV